MNLRELLFGLNGRTSGNLDTEILGLAYDSRKVSPGFLFAAIRGTRTDGNRFLPQAIANGAAGIVSSAPPLESLAMPWIQVDDERAALAILAANFYEHPTEELHLVGVTGTNGKTTTTYLVESILQAAGHTAAEAPDLEHLFRQVVDAGWRYAVMEVSSHAIEMKRVMGLQFEIAVFTNLSRDHLDFHGDMESYFEAKKKLFTGRTGVKPKLMVLNMDDPRYEDLRSIDPPRVITYGMQLAAEICPSHYHFGWDGTDATYRSE